MENSIKSSEIHNRKIVIEIRYEPNPTFIDSRGTLVKKLVDANLISNVQWEIGIGEIKIADSLQANFCRQIIYADIHRFSIVSSKKDTNEGFFHFAEKVLKIFKEIIPNYKIIRVGCRIQGTYQAKSNDYAKIVNGFKNLFPSQILVEDFIVKDLKFTLIYQNGQYSIGPVSKDDPFIIAEFPFDGASKNIGFAIDTDNFAIMSEEKEKINDSLIKDVYMTSISVEKSLFEKIKIL
jgi:hypothetical protein